MSPLTIYFCKIFSLLSARNQIKITQLKFCNHLTNSYNNE